MTWDVLITGGLVFDGHGAPPRREDVAIVDGRIAARGVDLPRADATEVIDATGRWVLPGMLDIHTHFDLEVELAPGLPEAVRHGTTTVVMSNCSLGIAFGAQLKGDENPIVDCFARVENIPKHVLERTVEAIDWDDTAAYLDHLRERPLGANVVPMIPHSMLRVEVMGLAESVSRDPSPAELARMEALLDAGMRQGYAGFSTDALPFHYLANDPNRKVKIPSQWTSRAELRQLTDVVRRHGRVWQATPPKDDPVETLRTFLLSSGRLYGAPLKTTAVAALDVHSNRTLVKLAKLLSRVINSRFFRGDFRMQALAAEFKVWADGPITPLFEEIDELRELNEPDLEDRAARERILDDPVWQARLRHTWNEGKDGKGVAGLKRRLRAEDFTITRDLEDMIVDGPTPVAAWDGVSMGEVHRRVVAFQASGGREGARDDQEAAALAAFPQVRDDVDVLIHLFRHYDLGIRWYTVSANRDAARVREALFDPQFLPGFNDSGAHLTNMAFYDANLRGLQMAADEGMDVLATHVRRLTSEPARFFGLEGVGTLDAGMRADIAIVDPQALAAWDPDATVEVVYREEFQHEQMVNRPVGIVTDVLVGGTVAFSGGEFAAEVGKEPLGQLLTAAGGA
jgi:N-acyl-D-aspartate/D-glutamate deacylase